MPKVLAMKKALFLVFSIQVLLVTGCWDSGGAIVCEKCGSTGEFKDKERAVKIIVMADQADGCDHRWREGVSSAYPSAIPDDMVVLLRRRDSCAALKLYQQGSDPKSVQFEWWYRNDGKGHLAWPLDGVHHGQGTGTVYRSSSYGSFAASQPIISFKEFTLGWSSSGVGQGYLYFPYFPGDVEKGDWVGICLTGSDNVEMNAFSSEWAYETFTGAKGHPSGLKTHPAVEGRE